MWHVARRIEEVPRLTWFDGRLSRLRECSLGPISRTSQTTRPWSCIAASVRSLGCARVSTVPAGTRSSTSPEAPSAATVAGRTRAGRAGEHVAARHPRAIEQEVEAFIGRTRRIGEMCAQTWDSLQSSTRAVLLRNRGPRFGDDGDLARRFHSCDGNVLHSLKSAVPHARH